MKLLAAGLLVSVLFCFNAQAQRAYVSPAQGVISTPFLFVSTDTAKGLPRANQAKSQFGGGIIDTSKSGVTRRTGWARVATHGAVSATPGMRYLINGVPTYRKQIAAICSAAATTTGGDTGTIVLLNVTTNTLTDSMFVYFRGTTFDDTAYQVIKKHTNHIHINRPFVAYTCNTDTCYTAEMGEPLFNNQTKTLWGEEVWRFKASNWKAATPCSSTVTTGYGQ